MAGAIVVVLFVIGCVCTVLAMETFSAASELVRSPLKWLSQRSSDELTLRQVLEDRRKAAFTIAEACEFPYAQGNLYNTTPDSDRGRNFINELTRQQVASMARDSLGGDLFIVVDREVRLGSGTLVQSSFVGTDSVYLLYHEETSTETSLVSRQVEGVVAGNTMSGSFYFSENTYGVGADLGGQQSTTVVADFRCPLQWLVIHFAEE